MASPHNPAGTVYVVRRENNNALIDAITADDLISVFESDGVEPETLDQVHQLLGGDYNTQFDLQRGGDVSAAQRAINAGNFTGIQWIFKMLDRGQAHSSGPAYRAALSEDDDIPKGMNGSTITAGVFGAGMGALHLAAVNPNVKKLSALLALEPLQVDYLDTYQRTPLFFAATCSEPANLRLLLEKNADRGHVDKQKRTAVMYAARAGRTDNVRVLMGCDGPSSLTAISFNATLFPNELKTLLSANDGSDELKLAPDAIALVSNLLIDLIHRMCAAIGASAPSNDAGYRAAILSIFTNAELKADIRADASALVGDGTALSGRLRRTTTLQEVGMFGAKFDEADTDGDGFLSRAEVEALVQSEGEVAPGDAFFDGLFEAYDEDKSGTIDRTEFARLYAAVVRRCVQQKQVIDVTAVLASIVGSGGCDEDDDALPKEVCQFLSASVQCVATMLLRDGGASAKSQQKSAIKANPHILTALQSDHLDEVFPSSTTALCIMQLQLKDKLGNTTLHHAATKGHIDTVQELLRLGSDVNAGGPGGKTALALAAERGHVEIVKLLISRGAKVDKPDKRKKTPLLLACKAGEAPSMAVLLRHGAETGAMDSSGNTVAHYAAAFGWTESVDLLNQAGADFSIPNSLKLTPIAAAQKKGHTVLIAQLLSECKVDVNQLDQSGLTLLMSSLQQVSKAGIAGIAGLIQQHGADTTVISSESSGNTTALHELCAAPFATSVADAFVTDRESESARITALLGYAKRTAQTDQFWLTADQILILRQEETKKIQQDGHEGDEKKDVQSDPNVIFHDEYSAEQRDAIHALGWNADTFMSGHNPTRDWSSLSEAELAAAATLELKEENWKPLPVQVISTTKAHHISTGHALCLRADETKVLVDFSASEHAELAALGAGDRLKVSTNVLQERSWGQHTKCKEDANVVAVNMDGTLDVAFSPNSAADKFLWVSVGAKIKHGGKLGKIKPGGSYYNQTANYSGQCQIEWATGGTDSISVNELSPADESARIKMAVPLALCHMRENLQEEIDLSLVLLKDENPVEVAAQSPHVLSVVCDLLTKNKADGSVTDTKGRTPMMLAMATGKLDLVSHMLDLGLPAYSSPLSKFAADDSAAQEICLQLCAHQYGQCLCPAANTMFSLPMGRHSHMETMSKLAAAHEKQFGKLDINIVTSSGDSLFLRTAGSSLASAQQLQKHGASLDGTNQDGNNVFHLQFSKMTAASFTPDMLLREPDNGAWRDDIDGALVTKLLSAANKKKETPILVLLEAYCRSVPNVVNIGAAEILTTTLVQFVSDCRERWPNVQFADQQKSNLIHVLVSACTAISAVPNIGLLVDKLVDVGSAPNQTDKNGNSALAALVQNNVGMSIPASLLACSLIPHTKLDSTNSQGETVLMQFLSSTQGLSIGQELSPSIMESIVCLIEHGSSCNVPRPETGAVALHEAARCRSVQLIELLLAQPGMDVNVVDIAGQTPIMKAVLAAPADTTANFDAEEALLRQGASVNLQDHKGRTCLHYAFLKPQDMTTNFSWLQTKVDREPGHFFSTSAWECLDSGAAIDPVESISSLCAIDGIQVELLDRDGLSPLHCACLRGASVSAMELIARGAKSDRKCPALRGNTAFGCALHVHPSLGILMMQKGVDINIPCELIGRPGQALPALTGPESAFSLLIRWVAKLGRSSSLSTSYLGAAYTVLREGYLYSKALNDTIVGEQFEMLLALLPKTTDELLISTLFDRNQNLLHKLAAVVPANDERSKLLNTIVLRLLKRKLPQTVDADGVTPLMLASKVNLRVASTLLQHGAAASCGQLDCAGRTALSYCLEGQRITDTGSEDRMNFVRSLLEAGVPNSPLLSRVVDSKNVAASALMVCIELDVDPTDKSKAACILYDGAGCDVSFRDACGLNALMCAAKSRSAANAMHYTQRVLHMAGDVLPLILSTDADGKTSLMHAVEHSTHAHIGLVLEEVEKFGCCDQLVSMQDQQGEHVLMKVVKLGQRGLLSMAMILSKTSAKTFARLMMLKDVDGRTPLMHAVMANDSRMVQLLTSRELPSIPSITYKLPDSCRPGEHIDLCFIGGSGGGLSFEVRLVAAAPAAPSVTLNAGSLILRTRWLVPSGCGPGSVATFFLACQMLDAFARPLSAHENLLAQAPGELNLQQPTPSPPLLSADQLAEAVNAKEVGTNSLGKTAALFCIRPREFGSYENETIFKALIAAGADLTVHDETTGHTGFELVAQQSSGKLKAVAEAMGLMVPDANADEETVIQMQIDEDQIDEATVGEHIALALQRADDNKKAKETADNATVAETMVDKKFQNDQPDFSKGSYRVLRDACGFWDIVMTKTDGTAGPYGIKNVFYSMQLIHETNQDLNILFTHWGAIGSRHYNTKCQITPLGTVEEAKNEFCKIFKSKSGNDFLHGSQKLTAQQFEKKPNTEKKSFYQFHEVDMSSTVDEALDVMNWKIEELPAVVSLATKQSVHRLLNVGSAPAVLRNVQNNSKVNTSFLPLGKLALSTDILAQAMSNLVALKQAINARTALVARMQGSSHSQATPEPQTLQELLEVIARLSSKYYELIPTSGHQHMMVQPITDVGSCDKLIVQLELLTEQAGTCRLLLAAQSQLETINPAEYLYRALGCSFDEVDRSSDEMRALEQYINLSTPECCKLYDGPGASKLRELPNGQAMPTQYILASAVSTSDTSRSKRKKQLTPAGTKITIRDGGAVKGRLCTVAHGWIEAASVAALTPLTARQTQSRVVAVHRVERRGEQQRMIGSGIPGQQHDLLFHGTSMDNLISILDDGLRVRPPGVHHSGSALGDGIYFANHSSKSLGYCSYSVGTGFALLCEVATGNRLHDIKFGESGGTAVRRAAAVATGDTFVDQLKPGDTLGAQASSGWQSFQNYLAATLVAKNQDRTLHVKYMDAGNVEKRLPRLNPSGLPTCQPAPSGDQLDVASGPQGLEGTGFHSVHALATSGPDPAGALVTPDGLSIPLGVDVPRHGRPDADEVVVCDEAQARVRYILELREQVEPTILRQRLHLLTSLLTPFSHTFIYSLQVEPIPSSKQCEAPVVPPAGEDDGADAEEEEEEEEEEDEDEDEDEDECDRCGCPKDQCECRDDY